MNKVIRITVVFLLISFVIITFSSGEETIRIASGEWSPYQSKALKHFGIASRIVTEAFALEVIKVEYGYFPCDLEVGYDLIQSNFTPDQAKRFTHHPRPIRADPHHLLLSKKNMKNKQMIIFFNRGLKRLQKSRIIERYWKESREGTYREQEEAFR